jgi:hypothetical protein
MLSAYSSAFGPPKKKAGGKSSISLGTLAWREYGDILMADSHIGMQRLAHFHS